MQVCQELLWPSILHLKHVKVITKRMPFGIWAVAAPAGDCRKQGTVWASGKQGQESQVGSQVRGNSATVEEFAPQHGDTSREVLDPLLYRTSTEKTNIIAQFKKEKSISSWNKIHYKMPQELASQQHTGFQMNQSALGSTSGDGWHTKYQELAGPAQTEQTDPGYRRVQNLPHSLSQTSLWRSLTHLAGLKEKEPSSSQETITNTQNTYNSTKLTKPG